MQQHRARSMPSRAARLTALVYAAIASGWILVTDRLVFQPEAAPEDVELWATAKGLGFVAVTSILLFLLVRGQLQRQAETERRFSTLGENLPGLVFRCENDPQWTMRDLSRACQALTGYAPEDVMDNALVAYGDLVHPEDRERVWGVVQEAVRTGRSYQVEYRLRRRDGTLVWISEQGMASCSASRRCYAGIIRRRA